MPRDEIPAQVRKRLAARLKELRGDMRQEDAVKALEEHTGSKWSVSKLSRIENNQRRVQPDEVEDLLDVYGTADSAECVKLKRWAKAARQRGRWAQGRLDLPAGLQDFLEREDQALAECVWEPLLLPALCQTAEYARALIAGLEPGIDHDELERRVVARLRRQEVLNRKEDPLELSVLIDESVLTREIADKAVMVAQLWHLVELSMRPNVTIQIVPSSIGAHPGLCGWFCLLEFPNPDDPDVGYADGPGGQLHLEDPDDIRACTLTFGHLRGIALTAPESVELIEAMADRLARDVE